MAIQMRSQYSSLRRRPHSTQHILTILGQKGRNNTFFMRLEHSGVGGIVGQGFWSEGKCSVSMLAFASGFDRALSRHQDRDGCPLEQVLRRAADHELPDGR